MFRSSGAVNEIIKKSTFEKIKIPIPPLEEKRAIAKILADLDEKLNSIS